MATPLGLGLRCPAGHRWYACRHEELAQPVAGLALVAVGLMNAIFGAVLILG